MTKQLPQKITAENKNLPTNPDQFSLFEIEGENGSEFVPIPTVLAESAMRQAEAAERTAGAMERLVEVLAQAHSVSYRPFESEEPEASQDPQP